MNYAQQLAVLNPAHKVYLAYLDVLGFSNFVHNNPHSEVVMQFQTVIRSMIDVSLAEVAGQCTKTAYWQKGENDDLEPNLTKVKINCISISDSIIFWTSNDNKGDLIELLATVRNLMAKTIHFGFPLRGAITHGMLTFDGGDVAASSIIMHLQLLGRPLVDASKLEKDQNWSGCVIHPEIIKRYSLDTWSSFEQHSLIVKYDVPLKQRESNSLEARKKTMYAINWPHGTTHSDKSKINPDSIRKSFEAYKKNEENPIDIEAMINNTIIFFNAMQLHRAKELDVQMENL